MITVLLVDDHAAIRQSIQHLIEKTDDMQVVATASNGIEAVAQVTLLCPDIIVMDVSMPELDGIEATRQILVHCSATRVLMLSTYDLPDYIRRALKVGASGYLLKDDMGYELVSAVRTLHQGNRYFSKQVTELAQLYIK